MKYMAISMVRAITLETQKEKIRPEKKCGPLRKIWGCIYDNALLTKWGYVYPLWKPLLLPLDNKYVVRLEAISTTIILVTFLSAMIWMFLLLFVFTSIEFFYLISYLSFIFVSTYLLGIVLRIICYIHIKPFYVLLYFIVVGLITMSSVVIPFLFMFYPEVEVR